MNRVQHGDLGVSFIITAFEEFYREVLSCKQLVLMQTWASKEESDTSSPESIANFILHKLQDLTESHASKAILAGTGFAKSYFADAQFAMVALADETFINLNWPGRSYWEANLLEQRIFGTHSAGQTFYDKLDQLLEYKDLARANVAVVYLNALGLGFRGKYRGLDDHGIIQGYLDRLFKFINRRDPYLFTEKMPLFSEAYNNTLEGLEPKDLPNARNWYFVFASIGFTYLIISYIIWFSTTTEISRIVNRIISIATVTS